MARSKMMDPRYAKAIKSTEELFTPIELQQMGIDPKNMIKTTSCNPYFEPNYKEKNKLKNTFIKNSDAGLYEFFAKEVQCSQDFINQKRRLKESFGKTKGFYTEEQKKEQIRKLVEYEKDMDLLFRNLSRICQTKAKGLCGIRDKSNDVYSKENLKEQMINEKDGKNDENVQKEIDEKISGLSEEQVIEAIKTRNPRFKELLKMSDDELGSGRKMLLMLNGFEKVGQGWKYSKELEDKFVKAASICRNNYLCVKTEFSDIPKEIGRFTEEILDGISKPYDYMYSKAMKMFGVSKQKAIERQQDKQQKLGDKVKRLEKEKEALATEKEKAKAKVKLTENLSKSERKKTEAKIAKIQKRENRIEKGQTISPSLRRPIFRNKNSLQTLQIKRSDAEYIAKRKGKELERMKKRKSSDYLNIISKITPKRLEEKQKLTNAVKKVEQKRLEEKIDLIEAKKKTGLTGSQKRDLEGRIWKNSLKTKKKKAETFNQKKKRLTDEKAAILERIETGQVRPGDYARFKRITQGTRFTNSLGKLEGKNIKTKRLERRKELYEALKTKKGVMGLTDNEQKQYKQLTQGDKLRGKKSVYELQGLNRGERKMKRIQNNLNILHTQKVRTNINESQQKVIDNEIKKIQGRLNPTGNELVRQIRKKAILNVKEEKNN